jgi:hypothetical protein
MAKAFNLEDFRVKSAELEELRRNQKVPEHKVFTTARAKHADAFAMIPRWWAARATEAGVPLNLMVIVEVAYRGWKAEVAYRGGKAKGRSFTMPNLEGVHHDTKNRTLRGLEQAGLITVKWRQRKSPVVALAVPMERGGTI